MPSAASFVLMFLGGAFGTAARYLIELSEEFSNPLALTFLVNLLGALLLGFVNTHSFFNDLAKRLFFGHGFLGGFTTMSGVALITGGVGLSLVGWLYWLAIAVQLLLGVLVYAAGVSLAKAVSK